MRIHKPHLPKTLKHAAAKLEKSVEKPLAKAVKTVGHAQVSAFQGATAAAKAATTTAAKAATTAAKATKKASKPSFFSKVGSFFSGVAKKVGSAVKTVAARVGDAVSGVMSGIGSAVVGVVKNLGEAAGTFASGCSQLFKGDIGGAFKAWGSSARRVLQTPVDATLMLGGRVISAVQTLVGLEPVGQKLDAAQIAELRKVYGDTIDYSKVRIKAGSVGVFGLTGRAFTHGDTIFIPKESLNADGSIPMETLVHEMGHVWQHQNGGTDYMSEALTAQWFGDAYDWKKGLDQGKSFSQLDPEQQAELLSEAYAAGYFDNPSAGYHVGGKDYTKQLEAALADVRARRGAP